MRTMHAVVCAPLSEWRIRMCRMVKKGFYSRLGSNCIRKPDMSKLVSDSGKLRVLDTLLPQLKAGGHKVCTRVYVRSRS
jgi:hypothetical protein